MKAQNLIVDTGSGSGISSYKAKHTCGMRVWLDEQQGIPVMTYDDPRDIGSAWHGYLQVYFKGGVKKRGYELNTVRFMQSSARPWRPSDNALRTAQRLFGEFRAKFPPNHFGRVLGVEKHYTIKKADWLPAGLILTAQLDLEVSLSSSRAAALSKQATFGRRRVFIAPGVWVVDHKTLGNPRYMPQYQTEIQFPAYQLVREAATGRTPNGLLVNVGLKSNPARFPLLKIPKPTKKDREMLKRFLGEAEERYLVQKTNPTSCFSWGRMCPHFSSGECPR